MTEKYKADDIQVKFSNVSTSPLGDMHKYHVTHLPTKREFFTVGSMEDIKKWRDEWIAEYMEKIPE